MTTPLKKIVLHKISMSRTTGASPSFTEFDVLAENEHEYVINESNGQGDFFTIIRKDAKRFGVGKSLAPIVLCEVMTSEVAINKQDYVDETLLTITRYVPDFYEYNEHHVDVEMSEDYYDLAFYDLATQEMQKHENFKTLAIDSNGELMTREQWESCQ